MENPIADLVESQIVSSNPRMPFEEQCAFHAALLCGVRNDAVAVATGLAMPTVAYLRHAGQHMGGQIRYPRVARERAQLGDQEFIHRYLNPKIRDRLAVAINQVKTKKLEPKPANGIRPNATRFRGRQEITALDGSKWAVLIKFTPEGWFYGYCLEPGRGERKLEHVIWQGQRDGQGFATSTDAYRIPLNLLTKE